MAAVPRQPEFPHLFPIGDAVVDGVFTDLAVFTEDELRVGRDATSGILPANDPASFVMKLGMRPELAELEAKEGTNTTLIRAYRSGAYVGWVVVQDQMAELAKQGRPLPKLTEDFAEKHYERLRRQPHLRATRDGHGSQSVIVQREATDFSRFFEDDAAISMLNLSLRSLWQVRRFGFMAHPEAPSYISLGQRDTFTLYEKLYDKLPDTKT